MSAHHIHQINHTNIDLVINLTIEIHHHQNEIVIHTEGLEEEGIYTDIADRAAGHLRKDQKENFNQLEMGIKNQKMTAETVIGL